MGAAECGAVKTRAFKKRPCHPGIVQIGKQHIRVAQVRPEAAVWVAESRPAEIRPHQVDAGKRNAALSVQLARFLKRRLEVPAFEIRREFQLSRRAFHFSAPSRSHLTCSSFAIGRSPET